MYSKFAPGYITRSSVIVIVGGITTFAGIELVTGGERFHKEVLMPTVHRLLDAEQAHRLAVYAAKYGLMPAFGYNRCEYPQLATKIWDRDLRNPIGLAAGFDKDAEAIDGLRRRSGFGFIEIGSVTPLPQPGNMPPRMFRLPTDEAVINRYGFNSAGHGAVLNRLRRAHASDSIPLGVNLGINKDTKDANIDYGIGVTLLGAHCDYVVINVSSPNTPNLRSLQQSTNLTQLMSTVRSAVSRLDRQPKVVLKISPDCSAADRKAIAAICLDRKKFAIDALIVANTTIQRPDTLRDESRSEIGGLSGRPLHRIAVECIADMYRLTDGRVPIIGCGGIASGRDAYEQIRAGASLVQLYTSMVYWGFPIVGKVKRELVECLNQDGFTCVADAVGIDHVKKKKK